MASCKLSELAEDDLRQIAIKTIEACGHRQAEAYILLLHEALNNIANTPDIGRKRPELFDNARSFPVQKHMIYYWPSAQGIEVARILHQRMDDISAFE